MSGWIYAVIAIVVVIVLAVLVVQVLSRRRTAHLKQTFGPEYDRATDEADGKRDAEAELRSREERRSQLDIRPLPAEARRRYSDQWQLVQAQFVDSPGAALSAADGLVNTVMTDRGYPMSDFDQRAADISVDHPQLVENYRTAHAITIGGDRATTEDQRQAMQRYRSLFDELLDGFDGSESTAGDREHAAARR